MYLKCESLFLHNVKLKQFNTFACDVKTLLLFYCILAALTFTNISRISDSNAKLLFHKCLDVLQESVAVVCLKEVIPVRNVVHVIENNWD